MFWDDKFSIWVHDGQPGITDRYIVTEVKRAYKELYDFAKDKVVLDVGGNIGATARLLAKVAKHVIVVEPEPVNFEILQKNLEQFTNVTLLKGGVGPKDGIMPLYVNRHNNTGLHTLIPTNGRIALDIQIFDFAKLLDTYKPDALKFDAEGAEQYVSATLSALPEYVKFIAIEYDIKPTGMTRAGFGKYASVELFNKVAAQFTHIRSKVPNPDEPHAGRHNGLYIGVR